MSWRNQHYSPRCESFDSNSGVLVPSDRFNCGSWFGWDARRKEIAVYEENSSCCNQKNTERDKQHFRFSYNKSFLRLLSLSRHRRNNTNAYSTKKVTQDSLVRSESDRGGKRGRNLICLNGVRKTTTDLCYRYIKGLFSRLCWQNYLDSQRFFFHFLVLIGPARFNKSFSQRSAFLSDSSKCLSSLQSLRFFSPGKSPSRTGEKCRCLCNRGFELRFKIISVSNRWNNVGLDLTVASDSPRTELLFNLSADFLYGVGRSIDNFWLRPWIMICKSPGPPHISYNL